MISSGPCYLYGLIRSDTGRLPRVEGVMREGIDVVESGRLAAVVSVLDEPVVRARRADLLAHSDVLQALIADRDVVPVRFGTIFDSAESIRSEFLDPSAPVLQELLDAVGGMVEVQVKAVYSEGAVAAALLGSDRRLRQLQLASRGGRHNYRTRFELGQRFAEALGHQRASDTEAMRRGLSPAAKEVRMGDLAGDYAVAKASCLVARDGLDEFDIAVAQLQESAGALMTLSSLGPLPPYSFVEADLAGVA